MFSKQNPDYTNTFLTICDMPVRVSKAATPENKKISVPFQISFLALKDLSNAGKGLTDILFQKHACSILRQSSNPVCGSWKGQACSLWAKQHRA